MKIKVKIPKGFTEDIEIDLTYGEETADLPFSEGETNEEIVEKINGEEKYDYEMINATAIAIAQYMNGGEQPVLGAYAPELGEVIPVGTAN
jgi:hypothetical protein